jgi:hypothetical protein
MNTAYYDMLILLQQQTQAMIRKNAPKTAQHKEGFTTIDDTILDSVKLQIGHPHSACVQLSSL